MTRNLQPGRQLDALVAEKVFNLALKQMDDALGYPHPGTHYWWEQKNGKPIPRYSEDIAAAWLLAEKLLSGHEMELAQLKDGRYFVQFIGGEGPDGSHYMYKAYGESAPHAIALAALAAVGYRAQ
jgi:hypothetical protein